MVDTAMVVRIERTWARHTVAVADQLARRDAGWGTEVVPVADGVAVLCGPGLYVNHTLDVGLVGPVGPVDFDRLQQRSDRVGVAPAIQVGPATDPSVVAGCERRGYLPMSDTSVLVHASPDAPQPAAGHLSVEAIGPDRLGEWQDLTALGWGHAGAAARRASDAYSAAAQAVEGETFFIATDVADGRSVGVASLSIRDGMATLGAMSTLPAERRRGVQTELLRYRVVMAMAHGCDLVVTSTDADSDSERNLRRLGYEPLYRKTLWERGSP